jgi:hypothetical protein
MKPSKLISKGCFAALIIGVFMVWSPAVSGATLIDFKTFPEGTSIIGNSFHETRIYDQFGSLGVIFPNLYPDSPRVKYDPNDSGIARFGILISGGPTGFYGDIEMEFVGPSHPNFVGMDIIGSGWGIGANLKAFNPDGVFLGEVTQFYNGPTGQDSPISFLAPNGETIGKIVYNGGLRSSAATIDNLSFEYSPSPVPEPATMFLLGTGLVGLLGAKKRWLKR